MKSSDAEVILDILLVCANKPTNFTHLYEFGYRGLKKTVREYVKSRHNINDLKLENLIETVIREFQGIDINILDFGGKGFGIQVSGTVRDQYVESEKYFQQLLFRFSGDRIIKAITDLSKSRSVREKRIVLAYLQYLSSEKDYEWLTSNDIERIRNLYQAEFEEEAKFEEDVITDTLVRARLAYRDKERIYPFWFVTDLGFRSMLANEIQKVLKR